MSGAIEDPEAIDLGPYPFWKTLVAGLAALTIGGVMLCAAPSAKLQAYQLSRRAGEGGNQPLAPRQGEIGAGFAPEAIPSRIGLGSARGDARAGFPTSRTHSLQERTR